MGGRRGAPEPSADSPAPTLTPQRKRGSLGRPCQRPILDPRTISDRIPIGSPMLSGCICKGRLPCRHIAARRRLRSLSRSSLEEVSNSSQPGERGRGHELTRNDTGVDIVPNQRARLPPDASLSGPMGTSVFPAKRRTHRFPVPRGLAPSWPNESWMHRFPVPGGAVTRLPLQDYGGACDRNVHPTLWGCGESHGEICLGFPRIDNSCMRKSSAETAPSVGSRSWAFTRPELRVGETAPPPSLWWGCLSPLLGTAVVESFAFFPVSTDRHSGSTEISNSRSRQDLRLFGSVPRDTLIDPTIGLGVGVACRGQSAFSGSRFPDKEQLSNPLLGAPIPDRPSDGGGGGGWQRVG